MNDKELLEDLKIRRKNLVESIRRYKDYIETYSGTLIEIDKIIVELKEKLQIS